ncbi:MAG: hypothetical protein HOP03_05360 [Lysobacter sp.]|nr:hypothetical protein [Lysobacter sp.]
MQREWRQDHRKTRRASPFSTYRAKGECILSCDASHDVFSGCSRHRNGMKVVWAIAGKNEIACDANMPVPAWIDPDTAGVRRKEHVGGAFKLGADVGFRSFTPVEFAVPAGLIQT